MKNRRFLFLLILLCVFIMRVSEVHTDSPLRTLSGHTGEVWSVSFSPDGTKLASGSADTTVLLWELAPTPPEPESIAEDVNGDGILNIQDLVRVAGAFGNPAAAAQ